MKDFKDFSDWDSTIIINGKKIIITVSLINGSDFFIPSQYTTDTNKVIKQILTKIDLFDGNRKELLKISTIDVKNYMGKEDEKIVKYGVLMLSKNDVSYKNDTLKLIYGYSIPYSDIGNQVTILVNTTNLEKSVHVEY